MWQFTNASYQNTVCKIKMNGKLSQPFEELLSVGQGRVRSSDHYLRYINPCLDTLEESELGVMVGNICVTADGVADDVYAMTDDPIKLKAIISLLENYSRKYRVPFGKGKTKIVVTGSLVDIQHYKDIKMWTMDGEEVLIVDENEHLGRVVTGFGEEEYFKRS